MGRNDLGRKCDPTYYADGLAARSRRRHMRVLKKLAGRMRRRAGKEAIEEQLQSQLRYVELALEVERVHGDPWTQMHYWNRAAECAFQQGDEATLGWAADRVKKLATFIGQGVLR